MTTISAAESANYLLINMDLSSVAIISNSIFQNMSVAILNCFDSEVNIVNSTYSYIVSNQYIFNFYQCYNIKFEQSKFTGWTTTQHIGIVIYRDSTIDYIKNSMFTNSQLITFVFISSNLTSFDNNTMSGVNKGIKFSNNWNATITNSNFINFVQNQSFINRNLRRVRPRLYFAGCNLDCLYIKHRQWRIGNRYCDFSLQFRNRWFECKNQKFDF